MLSNLIFMLGSYFRDLDAASASGPPSATCLSPTSPHGGRVQQVGSGPDNRCGLLLPVGQSKDHLLGPSAGIWSTPLPTFLPVA